MYRVVYCPQDEPTDEALSLASEWGLPIQHGDSERTAEMEFNRQETQVLSIPIEKGFNADEIETLVNQPVPVKYSNDWDSVSSYSFVLRPSGVKVGKTPWDVQSMVMDEHRAAMNVALNYPGVYELVAVKDGLEREMTKIIVLGADGEIPND